MFPILTCFDRKENREQLFNGLPLSNPKILIPWDIEEQEFLERFKDYDVMFVAEHYYSIRNVNFLGEEHLNIGVSFKCTQQSYPKKPTFTLREIGFSRGEEYYANIGTEKEKVTKSYNAFQSVLEKEFGKPTKKAKGDWGFDTCVWSVGNIVKLHHRVFERFCLEEHLYIEKVSRGRGFDKDEKVSRQARKKAKAKYTM